MTEHQKITIGRELLETHLSSTRFSKKYQNNVRRCVAAFISWLCTVKSGCLSSVSRKDILEYHELLCRTRSKLTGQILKNNTINSRFCAVKLFFSLLYRSGLIVENPLHGLRLSLPYCRDSARRALYSEEIETFLESLEVESTKGLRNRALFELMYSSGLRVCEVSRLKVQDINFERRELIIRGKFDRDRVVPLSKVAAAFLSLYFDKRQAQGEQSAFTGCFGIHAARALQSMSISCLFRALLKKYGMNKKDISAHSIRHATATHLLENGASIRHVQELLGHKKLDTTERYTHVQTESLSKIHRKFHPREHELFEVVDETYHKKVQNLFDNI